MSAAGARRPRPRSRPPRPAHSTSSSPRRAALRPTKEIVDDLRLLRAHHGPLEKTWNRGPFRVLIGTILSQRTRDENTAVATRQLFAAFPTLDALASADPPAVEPLIRPAGFYRTKARRIVEVSRIIRDRLHGKVPDSMEALLELPSVGRKTANCVLVYGFGQPAIPVDTHVHRIANRLGWVETRTPERTEEELCAKVPKRLWTEVNDLLVAFGQETCRPIGPWCGSCPIYDGCRWPGRVRARTRVRRRPLAAMA